MSWLTDYVPWWVWPLLLAGGGGAFFALVPGALAIFTTFWKLLPPWARWAIAGALALVGVYVGGRYGGAAAERAKNRERAEKARQNREEVKREVERMDDDEVDRQLREHGDFREEKPPRDRRG